MSIYWMKTAAVFPDAGWREDNAFSAFDPDALPALSHCRR
jgi:hypothetical protein